MDVVTLRGEIEAADNVARCSPRKGGGKANVMKGMPKNARLPNIVLRISRYRVFFENLNIGYRNV